MEDGDAEQFIGWIRDFRRRPYPRQKFDCRERRAKYGKVTQSEREDRAFTCAAKKRNNSDSPNDSLRNGGDVDVPTCTRMRRWVEQFNNMEKLPLRVFNQAYIVFSLPSCVPRTPNEDTLL